MKANKLWTRPDNGATRAKAPVVNEVFEGPFEEEEEGTGIASDELKVKAQE